MATITFDTRKAVRTLQAAGFAEGQADAVVDTLAEAFTDTVATKTDIAEVKTDIADLKAEVFRALWIQGAGIVALIVGLTKLL
ncbi:MAG: hypothetical protein OXI92_04005 [Acidobacteriota bacterium]|nr:hypothetical protein [Acidobacteriota bacterium]MDE2755697.1 hypothetical protein [Acidobacteriota bacterium]